MAKESEPRLLVEAAVLGVIGELAAQCFTYALRNCQHFFLNWIAGYRPPGLPEDDAPSNNSLASPMLAFVVAYAWRGCNDW